MSRHSYPWFSVALLGEVSADGRLFPSIFKKCGSLLLSEKFQALVPVRGTWRQHQLGVIIYHCYRLGQSLQERQFPLQGVIL